MNYRIVEIRKFVDDEIESSFIIEMKRDSDWENINGVIYDKLEDAKVVINRIWKSNYEQRSVVEEFDIPYTHTRKTLPCLPRERD